jgi:integrase
LHREFRTWFSEPLSAITIERLESWKTRRLNTGCSATTVLRERGVPSNTVRDLLDHSSFAMSLRYAHLAPDHRREAVAKLNEKPILALTMRSNSSRILSA